MKIRYEVLVAGVIKYNIIPDKRWSAQKEMRFIERIGRCGKNCTLRSCYIWD